MCHPSKIREEFQKIIQIVMKSKRKKQKLIDQVRYVYMMIKCLEINTLSDEIKKHNK